MALPGSAVLRRQLRLGTLCVGVAVAGLSLVIEFDPSILTAPTHRAVEATAAAYGTTPAVAFVTVHVPLLFGVVVSTVGSLYVGLLLPGGGGRVPTESAAVPGALRAAVRFYGETGVGATAVALGIPLGVVTATNGGLPAGLALAFVAGLPIGMVALCGATVGTALAGATGHRAATLLGTVAPVVGLVLAHVAPTGPVWTATAGATFTGLALLGGGWSVLDSRARTDAAET